MDFMRGCYFSKMRLFKDSDRLDEVRWYFAPQGAKYFPYYHNFASRIWQNQHDYPNPPVGEQVPPQRVYSKGANIGRTLGQCFIGDASWFLTGAPISILSEPEGNHPCCRQQFPPLPLEMLYIDATAGVVANRSADLGANVSLDAYGAAGRSLLDVSVSLNCTGGFDRLSGKTIWDYRLPQSDLTSGWIYPECMEGRWIWDPTQLRALLPGAGRLYPFTMPFGGVIDYYRVLMETDHDTTDDSRIRLSIYSTPNDSHFLPQDLVPGTTVEIHSKPARYVTPAVGPNVLKPGLYWLFIQPIDEHSPIWCVGRDSESLDNFANNVLGLSDGLPQVDNDFDAAKNWIYAICPVPYGTEPPPLMGPLSHAPHCEPILVNTQDGGFTADPWLPMAFLHMAPQE